jgi:dihydroorotate dehydrogenase (fumarate)
MKLDTTYMGLTLDSPIVPSASPLSQDIDKIKQMEDSGAGAVVLWSIFEEQVVHDHEELEYHMQHGRERFAESLDYFPPMQNYRLGLDDYVDHVAAAKQAVKMPVIASLNGISAGGWISYAKRIEEAGADAIELNVYYIPTDPELTAPDVEAVYLAVLEAVKDAVSIPVAMKLSPYFSAPAHTLKTLGESADGLVLFNRFYQPDIDIDELDARAGLELSDSYDGRLPLRWIAIMYGHVNASLAATSGVHTGRDAAKMILAGADVVQMCSALLKNGVGHIKTVLSELVDVGKDKGYESIEQMRGVMSQQNCAEPAAFERANYMKALTEYRLVGTGE